jgi:hypothetical protein
MSSYEIFRADIEPKGFQVIGFEEFITDATVDRVRTTLHDRDRVAHMVDHNYRLGRIYYSFRTLEHRLASVVSERLRVQNMANSMKTYR